MTLPTHSLDEKRLHIDIHEALKQWYVLDGNEASYLPYLLLVRDELRTQPENNPSNRRLATNRVLLSALEVLDQNEPEKRVLEGRFLDRLSINEVVFKSPDLTEDLVKKKQRRGIEQVTRIIFEREMSERQLRAQHLRAALPPATYAHLFGLDQLQDNLTQKLVTAGGPSVIALSGLGGIGKSSLADAVARTVADYHLYEKFLWIRIEAASRFDTVDDHLPLAAHFTDLLAQQLLPALPPETSIAQRNLQLRQVLSDEPTLIIIDNLEEAIPDDSLHVLRDLSEVSRFIITTRQQPPAIVGVDHIQLAGLRPEAIAAFMAAYASQIGVVDLHTIEPQLADDVYQLVGGNPLAIQLVINLARIFPLDDIFADLTKADMLEVEALFRHIYWRLWSTLDSAAQTLLTVMPLIGNDGADSEQLQQISGLESRPLRRAISELVNRSLLEVRGTIRERRYGVHRLTESFIKTEIIHWPAAEG